MKRIVVGLLAAFLTMAGLVGVSSSPATAACPYTNCVATSTNSAGPTSIAKDRRVSIRVGVLASGNRPPRGVASLTYFRKGQKGLVAKQSQIVSVDRDINNKSNARFRTPRLNPGTYRIIVRFKPSANSVFNPSKGPNRTLTIRNR